MVFFLAGTSDARNLAIQLKEHGFDMMTTVVTENASLSLAEAGLPVHVGRLTAEEMAEKIKEQNRKIIVDASHPYAEEASKNAMEAAKLANVPYVRYERKKVDVFSAHPLVQLVDTYEEAAKRAAEQKGVIMLTTGSKTLDIFAKHCIGVDGCRLVARMLPRKDNMEKCERLGVEQKNIVAIQGPFSKELNRALYQQYGVTLMVTKESGKVGSVDEKLEAALELEIPTIMIRRPKIKYDVAFESFEPLIKYVKETLRGE